MKLKHVVLYDNILDRFSFRLALAKFNHLIFQITTRWLFIADIDYSENKKIVKIIPKDTNNISYTFSVVWKA